VRDSEILWEAASRVKRGWTKGVARDENGSVCLVRAIGDVIRQPLADIPLSVRLLDHLRDTLKGESPLKFNDHPDTTKTDVIELLVDTAIRLEEQGL